MEDKKELTLQELEFLDFLFDGGTVRHPEEAKRMALYPADYPVLKIIKKVNKEFIEKCDNYLLLYGPSAIAGLLEIIADPTIPGSKIKLQAITELLDRAGIVAKDKTEVMQQGQSHIFFLPNKVEINNEA